VHSENPEVERERSDTPPLDWLLARDRRGTKETEGPIFSAAVSDEIPAGGRGDMPFGIQLLGQSVNGLHSPPRIGPSVFVLFAQFSTLSEIAGVAGVFDQASGEEIAFVLNDWRIASQVPELLANLDRPAECQQRVGRGGVNRAVPLPS